VFVSVLNMELGHPARVFVKDVSQRACVCVYVKCGVRSPCACVCQRCESLTVCLCQMRNLVTVLCACQRCESLTLCLCLCQIWNSVTVLISLSKMLVNESVFVSI